MSPSRPLKVSVSYLHLTGEEPEAPRSQGFQRQDLNPSSLDAALFPALGMLESLPSPGGPPHQGEGFCWNPYPLPTSALGHAPISAHLHLSVSYCPQPLIWPGDAWGALPTSILLLQSQHHPHSIFPAAPVPGLSPLLAPARWKEEPREEPNHFPSGICCLGFQMEKPSGVYYGQ